MKKRKNSAGGVEFAGRAQHRAEAAGLAGDPPQQQQADSQHERRADAFQKFDGLDAAPDHDDVQRPEGEEADPDAARQRRRARPQDLQHGVDGLAADPGLNAEPSAGHQRAQHRRDVGAAHAERGAHQHRKRNAVLRAGVRVQQHGDQHDQVAQQNGARWPATSSCRRRSGPRPACKWGCRPTSPPRARRSCTVPQRARSMRNGREVFVVEGWVVGRWRRPHFHAPPRAARFR